MTDKSLKAMKVHGKFVRCQICKEHNAVERFFGVLVCRKCLRPMSLGFLIGEADPAEIRAVNLHPRRFIKAVDNGLKRGVIALPEKETEVGNDDTA